MKAVCAWCNKIIREGTEPVTHTICPECDEKLRKDLPCAKCVQKDKKIENLERAITRLRLRNDRS